MACGSRKIGFMGDFDGSRILLDSTHTAVSGGKRELRVTRGVEKLVGDLRETSIRVFIFWWLKFVILRGKEANRTTRSFIDRTVSQ